MQNIYTYITSVTLYINNQVSCAVYFTQTEKRPHLSTVVWIRNNYQTRNNPYDIHKTSLSFSHSNFRSNFSKSMCPWITNLLLRLNQQKYTSSNNRMLRDPWEDINQNTQYSHWFNHFVQQQVLCTTKITAPTCLWCKDSNISKMKMQV